MVIRFLVYLMRQAVYGNTYMICIIVMACLMHYLQEIKIQSPLGMAVEQIIHGIGFIGMALSGLLPIICIEFLLICISVILMVIGMLMMMVTMENKAMMIQIIVLKFT